MMKCEGCSQEKRCTRKTINKFDGYCWYEHMMIACYNELGYEAHDCIFCERHKDCQQARKNRPDLVKDAE